MAADEQQSTAQSVRDAAQTAIHAFDALQLYKSYGDCQGLNDVLQSMFPLLSPSAAFSTMLVNIAKGVHFSRQDFEVGCPSRLQYVLQRNFTVYRQRLYGGW